LTAVELFDCRAAFAATLLEIASADPRACVVLNDSISSSSAAEFMSRFPERTFDVGIAEQNMVGVAAGLANAGYVPFVCAASCFLTGRALEQIKVDVAYSRANVKLCGFSSGVAYGALGPTHHAIEDIAWMRAIPGLQIVVPADPAETSSAIRYASTTAEPCFIRINRLPVPKIFRNAAALVPGKAQQVRDGDDVTLVGLGMMTHRLMEAAELLAADGLQARVLNLSWLNPVDVDAIVRCSIETGRIVTAEDHVLAGGLGGAVSEVVAREYPVPVLALGIPNTFAPTGSPDEILEHFELDAASMAKRVAAWLGVARTRRDKW